MTVNYSFDLEDDDLLDDTFRSIPENDLLSYSLPSPAPKNNDFQTPSISNELECSNINTDTTDSNRNISLSFLLKRKESVTAKQKGITTPEIPCSNKAVDTDETTKINSRFVPGFTPKAKKRKLPGLPSFLSESNDLHFQPIDSEHLASKTIGIQNITNSQFSSEDLLLPSWQNLQSEVSSCHNLLSTAKYYSIRRVLHETSKKKLPKHLVVPVLCVLIKKYNPDESSLVFMDDTGEISGKIDKEVFDVYKDVIREKTALILKKVTCICNVLILKKQNLVSIYLDDGSVKHVQDLSSMLEKEEPLKPMNCQCPGTPNEQKIKNRLHSKVCKSTPISLNANPLRTKQVGATSYAKASVSEENSCNITVTNSSPCPQTPIGKDKVLNILEAMVDGSKSGCSSKNIMSTSSLKQNNGETFKSASNVASSNSASCSSEVLRHNLTSNTVNKDKKSSNFSKARHKEEIANCTLPGESLLEEDLFCDDTDEFDEILCSLDEKSFL